MGKEPEQGLGSEESLDLFSDTHINLDVLAAKVRDIHFTVSDVKDVRHEFAIPKDIPFELGLAFLETHDAWARAQVRMSRQKSDQGRAAKLQDVKQAWADTKACFLELLRIRQPDVAPKILDQFGQGALENWFTVLIARMHLERLRFAGIIGGQAQPEAGAEGGGSPLPRAARRRAQRKRKSST